eukprot:SAG11_NODE_101_length_16738_cov_8.254703_5_plen_52_part_00
MDKGTYRKQHHYLVQTKYIPITAMEALKVGRGSVTLRRINAIHLDWCFLNI